MRVLNNNFAVLLAKKKLTVSKVSKETGISRATLSKLYHEKAQRISFKTLDTLCKHLKITLNEFFVENEEKERS